jgi:putative PIN family toxin of toxin-antitoxin system
MSEGRYVFDTNVIVSALLFVESTPGQAFLSALDHGVLLVSLAQLSELQEVLSRPKFDRYLPRQDRDQFLAALVREATLVDVTEHIQACRDPKDNHVLELAVSGQATCIISGDHDLLVLNPFRNIPILDPATFLATWATPPEHNP